MKPKVLYLSHADEALYDLIRQAAGEDFEVLTLEADDDGERAAKLADADAVIVASKPFTRPLIEAARTLAFVHYQGVGYQDTIDLAALAERAPPPGPAHAYQAGYDNAIGHFVERLRSDLPFETAPDDNLRSLALVEAAYRKAPRRESSRPASISP